VNEPRIRGFEYRALPGSDGVALNAAVGGDGSPVMLLHGFPQTHLMWRKVATILAGRHTVICPDLRGYGDSDKPAATSAGTYSKRTMGADIVAAAGALGFDTFGVIGHDRGALVAIRMGLDHPGTVTHVGTLDVLPTLDMWDILHGADAAVAWHLYLMAQPPGLPERMIAATADQFFGSFLDGWGAGEQAIPADVRNHYLRASANAVDSIVADYRASAGIDLEHDKTDRAAGSTLRMPVTAVQQDWGSQLGFDAAALWRAWCDDLDHVLVEYGHFMAEEAPDEISAIIECLLSRQARA
jgi:pimeloyl-ACP methyl ester carboxylesterase